MKEEFDRKPGLNPASWKYGVGWIDGTPLQQHPHQTFMVNGKPRLAHGRPGQRAGGRAARRCGALAARPVDEPARLPQSGAACPAPTRRRCGGGSSARWAATVRRPCRRRSRSSRSQYGQVPDRRDHQQGEHAAADPHLGARSGARRHELRARVHQRQLRRHRQRHAGFPTGWHSHEGWDDNFRRAEHHRRPQRVRRHVQGHQGQRVRRSGDGARRRCGRRRSPFASTRSRSPTASYLLGGVDAQQRRRRVQGLRRGGRSAARRGAQPGGDRGGRRS